MVEAYLPVNEMDIKLHGLLHLVEKIHNIGPLWTTSMFPYESMWGKLVAMLSLLRSFADFELAAFAYWRDPDGFMVPGASLLTTKYAAEVSARFQIPMSAPNNSVSLQLKFPRPPKHDDRSRLQLRLAVHQYYIDFDDR